MTLLIVSCIEQAAAGASSCHFFQKQVWACHINDSGMMPLVASHGLKALIKACHVISMYLSVRWPLLKPKSKANESDMSR
jgi:hypothetical protein